MSRFKDSRKKSSSPDYEILIKYCQRRISEERKKRTEKRRYEDQKTHTEKKRYEDRKTHTEKKRYEDRKTYIEKKRYEDRKTHIEKKRYEDRKTHTEKKRCEDQKTYKEEKKYEELEKKTEEQLYEERKIYISGLNWGTTEEEVRKYFSTFGNITNIDLINNSLGIPKGYGFVDFESRRSLEKIFKVDDHVIHHKKITVKKALIHREKMLVNNLTSEITDNDIKRYFEQYGIIIFIERPQINYCFITFESDEITKKVLQNPKHIIKTRAVDVGVKMPRLKDSGSNYHSPRNINYMYPSNFSYRPHSYLVRPPPPIVPFQPLAPIRFPYFPPRPPLISTTIFRPPPLRVFRPIPSVTPEITFIQKQEKQEMY